MATKRGTQAKKFRAAAPRVAVARRVRKNMDMDAAKLRAAQNVLGAKSETEAVDRALDLVLGRARFDTALDRLAERGGFYGYDDAAP